MLSVKDYKKVPSKLRKGIEPIFLFFLKEENNMKHSHHAGKHREKKHLMEKDHVNRQEKMASLTSSSKNNHHMDMKQKGETTNSSTTPTHVMNKETAFCVQAGTPLQTEQTAKGESPSVATFITEPTPAAITTTITNSTTVSPIAETDEQKTKHPNAREKFATQCKRMSEHLHNILKHLF